MGNYKILSLQISDKSYSETGNKIVELAKKREASYICFANVHMCIEAYEDPKFAEIVNKANMVCADGMTLVKAIKLKYKKNIERVAGMDMMPTMIEKCEKEEIKVFFLGTTDELLNKIKERIGKEHPQLKVGGYFSPPFKKLTDEEKEMQRKIITDSGAQLVFVALGCPKQERWMAENSAHLNAVLLGVGGAFPIFAKEQKRAPEWIRSINLEWSFRLIQDPQRLFKRYFYTNSKFIALFIKNFFK